MDIKKLISNFSIKAIGGAEDTEPVLKPYNQTQKQLLLSKDIFDVIDLIGEGPIEGLVDGNGARARGNRNLCGVYLDDTPVRVTRKQQPSDWVNEITWPILNTGSNSPSASDPDGIVYELASYDDAINALASDENLSDEDYAQIDYVYRNNEILKAFFRSLKEKEIRTRDPFQLYQTPDIKFAFIPHDQISFTSLETVTVGSTDYAVYYSGVNGTGELYKRYARRGNPNSSYFEQSTAVEIPEPILNIATKVGQYTPNYITVNGGYIILPLASGDGLTIDNGRVKFSAVDGNCLDPVSQELEGAYLFLKARTDDLTNSFNFEQFDLSVNYGYENQPVLANFPQTVRSYETQSQLYGPITDQSFIDTTDPVSRVKMTPATISAAYEPNEYRFDALTPTKISEFYGKAVTSTKTLGSSYNYAKWAIESLRASIGYDESVFTHQIENSAVTAVSIILTINALNDLKVFDEDAGEPVPTFATLRVEVGIDGDSDQNDPLWDILIESKTVYDIGIEGLVQGSPFRFTIGDLTTKGDNWIATTTRTKGSLPSTEEKGGPNNITLPPPIAGRSRYVRVYRLTPETFSTKKNIEFSLNGINEHYAYSFSYPLSATVGVSLDARGFSRIPTRTYDLRLKKVLIPSNYYPLDSQGMDRREIKSAASYNNDIQLYNGDWDGTFRMGWTDNPAWILYDLLVDPIYGIGNNIDDFRDIDIWTLYQIGRYSDAVDDDGYYIGVDDGYGGLEPRFACNVMLENERDAFDIVNSLASIFRGITFYGGGSMNFAYDHPKDKMAIFGNHNVKDGSFQYSDTLKSSRFTVVEVPYIERRNGYLQKIEAAEDELAIQKYGYIKKTFEGFGTTSRGQAQRFAKYALYSNNIETEMVSFVASQEGFYIQPSDIIKIDDELKSLDVANGYVVNVDYDNKAVITNWIPTGSFSTGVLFYTATGRGSIQDLFDKAYDQDLDVTISNIRSLDNPQIQLFNVSSYEQVSTSIGNTVVGSGLKINLDTGQSNISQLSEVREGSMFSVSLTGRDDNLYRVVGIQYGEEDEITISAIQYEPRKFALIESGIYFEQEDSFWSNRSMNMMINAPTAPLGVSLYTGISNGVINFSGFITGNTSGIAADKFYCRLRSPAGSFYEEIVDNDATPTDVYFYGLTELGTYSLTVKSIGPEPNKLKSTSISTSLTVTDESTWIYPTIGITGFNLMGGFGQYDIVNKTGNFESFGKDVSLNWQLRDRMGSTLSSPSAYRTKGNIKVSVDILDKDGNERVLGVLTNAQQNSFSMSAEKIEGIFNGSYPRNFQVVLNASGQSANDNSGILTILNNPPTIQGMGVLDYYDGIANNMVFNIKGDRNAIRDSDQVIFLTGASSGFQGTGEGNTLLHQSFSNNIIPKQKRVTLFNSGMYPIFVNNIFAAERSLRDYFFVNGEHVLIESNGTYPDNITANTLYELIRGDAVRTFFSIDAENAEGTGTGVYINNRAYVSGITDEWRLFDYAGNNWSTHTTTGVLSKDDTDANAPRAVSTGIYNDRTDRHGGLLFNGSGALRIAGDYISAATITSPTQTGRYDFVLSVHFNPYSGWDTYDPDDLSTIRTLVDMSWPSGGLYLAMITGTSDAEKMISGNIKLAGDSPTTTGETITLVSQTGYNWEQWNHAALTLASFSGDNCYSGMGKLIVNGTIRDEQLASGSGMRFCLGPQAIGASAGLLITGNDGRTASSMDREYIGYLNALNIYDISGSLDEVQAMRYGTYNQYIFQVAATGTTYPLVLGNNADDALSVVANSGSILQFNINNYNNAETTLLDKIPVESLDGIQKLAYLAFDTATSQLEKDLIGLYSLREEDYIAGHVEGEKTLVWQHFEGRPLAFQYISGSDNPDDTAYPSGGWAIWSGNIHKPFDPSSDKIFYSMLNNSYLNQENLSGSLPISTPWITGRDATTYSLSLIRTPTLTRRAGPAQKSRFKDMYVRAILLDDVGTGNIFPPLSDPAMPLSYVVVDNESQTLLGYQAKILGDQSRSLSDYIFAAYDYSGTAFADFDTFITDYIGAQSTESYIPEEQPAGTVSMPSVSPSAGSYGTFTINIQITPVTTNSIIHYKLWTSSQTEPSTWTDGSAGETINLNGISILSEKRLKAYASKPTLTDSSVVDNLYWYESDL